MTEFDVTKLIKETLNGISYKNKKLKAKMETPVSLNVCPIITYNLISNPVYKMTTKGVKTKTFSYSVNIWTDNAVDRSKIGELVEETLQKINFLQRQMVDSYETDTKIFRRYAVYTAEIDKQKEIIYGGI